jgi:dethiobiotin synthetase
MRTVFVTGAGTELGKTYVACAVIRALKAQGLTVDAFKPAVSGFAPEQAADSDPGRLLEALGRPITAETLDQISPLQFKAPLSPPAAARREGRSLGFEEVLTACRARLEQPDVQVLLVEGAGGVMSPIAEDATNLDLIAALGAPALLVGGSYLGAISHNLTALAALKARGCRTAVLALSESPDGVDLQETASELRRFWPETPVVTVRRDGGADAVLPHLFTPAPRTRAAAGGGR